MHHRVIPIYNGSFDIQFDLNNKSLLQLAEVPSFLFLIVGDDGEAVIVDTGFSRRHVPGLNPSYRRDEHQEVPRALERLGFPAGTIRQVVLTHLHWDHTGGIHHFPKATFFVQTSEFKGLTDLKPNEETYYAPDHFIPILDRMTLVNGEQTLRPGITLILTGRHTRGHQIVKVDTNAGPVYLLGDAPFNYDDLWKTVPKEFWDAYRQGETRRFYWSDKNQALLNKFIENKEIDKFKIPRTPPLISILKSGQRTYTTHDHELTKSVF